MWTAGPFADTGGPIALSSPGLAVLDGGGPSVVVGDRSGHVYALHVTNGSEVAGWPASTPGGLPVDSTPSASGGAVFVGVGDAATPTSGGYESFAANGGARWYRTISLTPGGNTNTGVRASLTIGSLQGATAVMAGSEGQQAEALNTANGAVLSGWPFFTADSTFSTAAIGDIYRNGQTDLVEGGDSTAGVAFGHTYTNGGHVRVLSPTGQLLCDYDANQVVQSSPAIGQFLGRGAVGIVVGTGTFYSGASQTNQLLALNPHCGLAWTRTLDGATTSSPALADALGNGQLQVVEGTDNGSGGAVWLLNGSNGATIWHVGVIGRVIGSVVTADLGRGYQDVLVPTTNGLEILDGRTGSELATVAQNQLALQNSPLVTGDANGTVGITIAGYNGSNQGVVEHFEVAGSPGGRAAEAGAWPMFHHDSKLTGNAGIAPPVVAVPCRAPAGGASGYYLTASDGGIFPFGRVAFCGSTGNLGLTNVVSMAATRDGGGYWIATATGAVYAFGDAHSYGSLAGRPLNKPIVAMAATRDGKGYWLVATDGGVFPFGDAHFYGSTGAVHLNKPIVGMAADPITGGYWLVASDGGIFQFHAPFHGSTGNIHLNKPIVGMAADAATGGYWLVATDGGIFDFDAPFHGSTGSVHLNQPIVGMGVDPATNGYWLVASDGGIFQFDAPFYGSTGAVHLNRPIIGMAGV